MKKRIFITLAVILISLLGSYELFAKKHSSTLTDAVSKASFGTKKSRVQFHKRGKELKISYNVGSYDVTSGPTYFLSGQKGDTLLYSSRFGLAVVSQISSDSVTVSWDGNVQVFAPRSRNLGEDPANR